MKAPSNQGGSLEFVAPRHGLAVFVALEELRPAAAQREDRRLADDLRRDHDDLEFAAGEFRAVRVCQKTTLSRRWIRSSNEIMVSSSGTKGRSVSTASCRTASRVK